LVKTGLPTNPKAGDVVRYDLTLHVSGSFADAVTMTDVMPNGLLPSTVVVLVESIRYGQWQCHHLGAGGGFDGDVTGVVHGAGGPVGGRGQRFTQRGTRDEPVGIAGGCMDGHEGAGRRAGDGVGVQRSGRSGEDLPGEVPVEAGGHAGLVAERRDLECGRFGDDDVGRRACVGDVGRARATADNWWGTARTT
jgi:hypothetical protein